MSAPDAALGVSWRRAGIGRIILLGCGALLLLALVFSLAIGPVVIAPSRVFAILWDGMFGVRSGSGADLRDAIAVLDIRLPRTALAALVGASLGVAGAVLREFSAIRRSAIGRYFAGAHSPGRLIVFGGSPPYLPRLCSASRCCLRSRAARL
jgi:ABC-type enterobactin transport system permease subunit